MLRLSVVFKEFSKLFQIIGAILEILFWPWLVCDSEVAIDGYSTVRNDRIRKGGGVACYIRSDICYTRKTCFSDNLENIFIDLLFPKTKPISVHIFYKPPSQTRFLEQIITGFESLELDNKI